PWMDRDIRRGLWTKPDAISLRECVLGVVGVGNIGKAVARRARVFGMTVIGTDPAPVPASFIDETGLRLTGLRALLEDADFVCLHAALTPTPFHLIAGADLPIRCPWGAVINAPRALLIEGPALVRALGERWIPAAALAFFGLEPLPADSPLRAMDCCL